MRYGLERYGKRLSYSSLIETSVEPKKVYSAFLISVSSFLMGLHLTIMSMLREKLTILGIESQKVDLILPVILFGAFLGNVMRIFLRYSLKIHSLVILVIYFIGHILVDRTISFLSENRITSGTGFSLLILGRIIIGLAVGNACAIIPSYLFHIAPYTLKGTFGCFHGTGIVIGILSGQISNWLIPTEKSDLFFRILLIIYPVAFPFTFFIQNVQNVRVIREKTIKELFQCKEAELSLFNAIFLHIGQQLSGINPICIFCDVILRKSVKISPEFGTVLVGCINVIFTLFGMYLVDRAGRKSLLIISSVTCIFALISLSLNLQPLISLFAFFIGFSIGLGPVIWLLIPEMFTDEYKSSSSAVSTSLNWLCAGLLTLLHPFLFDMLKERVFWIYSTLLSIIFVLICIFLSDTKGKEGKFQKF